MSLSMIHIEIERKWHMKFKKIKKRNIYETWKHTNRRTRIVSYIYYSPASERYHFEIISKNDSVHNIVYSSLMDGKTFQTFDETVNNIKSWLITMIGE